MAETLYWYDFETTGINPARDRVVQFAGIRTDLDFNPIAAPDVFYCKLHNDVLPHPEACLITGISPQLTIEKGLLESEFIKKIHQQFIVPQTCVVGYNSIRFDDEFTRNLLYRNFYDPYAREWKSGNSRWDLIDVVRMTQALRPEGINWPIGDKGAVSFKLELLTKANGIAHEAAHDALSDVYATIGIAKLIKQKQPKLYSWAYELRQKNKAAACLDLVNKKSLVHVSSKYPASQDCLAIVMPLAQHPVNKNSIIVYDLRVDPTALIKCSAEEIYQRLYTPKDKLIKGEERIPLKLVHINKSPMLAPLNTLSANALEKLTISLQQCEKNRLAILGAGIESKLMEVYSINNFEPETDPDLMLYGGGFFSPADNRHMEKIRHCQLDQLAALDLPFEDERLPEMLFRYRARNYPNTLNQNERSRWQSNRRERLSSDKGGLNFEEYFKCLDELVMQDDWTDEQQVLLNDLVTYGQELNESVAMAE